MSRHNLHASLIASIAIASALATACSSTPSNAAAGAAASAGPQVKTINYEPDGKGYLRFCTNDEANCRGGNGSFDKALGSQSPSSSLELGIRKDSGKSGYMYGAYFCSSGPSRFYRLLLGLQGVCEVFKCDGSDYRWWNFRDQAWVLASGKDESCYLLSPSLKKGYGAENVVKVVLDGSGSFDLYFNGEKGASFSDSSFVGGTYGLMTYVGTPDTEDFPTVPVDVRYKLISAL